MRGVVQSILGSTAGSATSGSVVSVWIKRDGTGDWLPYFHLISNVTTTPRERVLDDFAIVSVENVDRETLLSFIPDGKEGDGGTREISVSTAEYGELSHRFEFDAEMHRRSSQAMDDWGVGAPCIYAEYQTEEDNVACPSQDVREEILEELSRRDISLTDHRESIGNVLVAIADRRAKVTDNRTESGAVERSGGDRRLTTAEALDRYANWIVDLNGISVSDIDVVFRWEDAGSSVCEKPLDTSEENAVSIERIVESVEDDTETATGVRIVTEGGAVTHYPEPSAPAVDAGDLVVRVSKNGVVLDKWVATAE